MQKLKLFLFGCCVGAGVIFTGLQYHLVRNQDGFQFVPRTPQQSLGLAYTDVRHWNEAQWADRPELMRALVAHGASDLIASSLADNAADSTDPENSTLDQLRLFLNETPPQDDVSDDLLDDSVFRRKSPTPATEDAGDIFSMPFPDSAQRIQPLQDSADSTGNVPRTNVARSDLSIDDIFAPRANGVANDMKSDGANVVADTQQMRAETGALEDVLFPEIDSEQSSRAGSSPEGDGSIFQDVTKSLDRRATDALQRAQSGFRSELDTTLSDGSDAIIGYVREKTEQLMPDSVSKMFRESATSGADAFSPGLSPDAEDIPPALRALREGFDPFLSQ